MEAPLEALPSETQKSYQALKILRAREGSKMSSSKPDNSGIPVADKIAFLKGVHEDLSHLGGRDAIVTALKEEGKTWQNVDMDAEWICKRCERCLSGTTRGKAKGETRHLPTPGQAGEVIGLDLKIIKPMDAPVWIMLLAVDFCTNKRFAWDLDKDRADLQHVQGMILCFFCEQELPLVSWSDNGRQFRNVIQEALEKSIGVKARHIPPGRPQANGLVECFNKILDMAHGGNRARLMQAVLAYNTMPVHLLKVCGEFSGPWSRAGEV